MTEEAYVEVYDDFQAYEVGGAAKAIWSIVGTTPAKPPTCPARSLASADSVVARSAHSRVPDRDSRRDRRHLLDRRRQHSHVQGAASRPPLRSSPLR
jgi:hypothetical protein